jgi:hypothetical protein
MKYITIYEVTKETFPMAAFVCFLFSALCIAMFFLIKRNSFMAWIFTVLALIIGIFLIVVAFWALSDHQKQTNELLKTYQNGNYLSVEGKVENFHAKPPEGHDSEHFNIGEVYFDLPAPSSYGYSKCKNFGGDIKGDGQLVKIRYINYNGENVIMKLEIASP